eukprot:Sdes_comp19824_c0_seq1m11996
MVGINAFSHRVLTSEGFDESLLEKIQQVKKLCNSGNFYFSLQLDLTLNMGKLYQKPANRPDASFVWNRQLLKELKPLRFPQHPKKWLLECIRGFVEFRVYYLGKYRIKIGLISRQDCERAGTRFQIRGVDDDGNCANFVETEQIFTCEESILSLVQIRGSVPIFWDQPGKLFFFFFFDRLID